MPRIRVLFGVLLMIFWGACAQAQQEEFPEFPISVRPKTARPGQIVTIYTKNPLVLSPFITPSLSIKGEDGRSVTVQATRIYLTGRISFVVPRLRPGQYRVTIFGSPTQACPAPNCLVVLK